MVEPITDYFVKVEGEDYDASDLTPSEICEDWVECCFYPKDEHPITDLVQQVDDDLLTCIVFNMLEATPE